MNTAALNRNAHGVSTEADGSAVALDSKPVRLLYITVENELLYTHASCTLYLAQPVISNSSGFEQDGGDIRAGQPVVSPAPRSASVVRKPDQQPPVSMCVEISFEGEGEQRYTCGA
jgi:hypothetical protein